MGRGRFLTGILLVVAFVAAACSSGPGVERQSVEVPEEQAGSSSDAGDGSSAADDAGDGGGTVSNGLDGVEGLIATGGPNGLNIVKPNGELVVQLFDGRTATQPTWSRDGRRIIATLIDEVSEEFEVVVFDVATRQFATAPARRPYYFYTWSADSSIVAALGPGQEGPGQFGISADLLDSVGRPLSADSLFGGSLFVAWEPDGSDLLVHIGPSLIMISDPTDLETFVDFGVVGNEFQAPSWIPGTRDIIYVEEIAPDQGRFVRRNVDTNETTDLGLSRGFPFFSVHPDGQSMVIAQSQFDEEGDGLRLESVDLSTGERAPISDALSSWLEWSPDGESLLLTTRIEDQLSWGVWDGAEITDLGPYEPSQLFIRSYLAFGDAYVESRRLWSPDGAAVTFTSAVEGGLSVTMAIRLDDGTRVELGNSEVAFWSPVDVVVEVAS